MTLALNPRRGFPQLVALTLVFGLATLQLSPGTSSAANSPRVGSWQAPIVDLADRIFDDYRGPAYRWSAGHRGVDAWVEPGESLLSPMAGSVHFAGQVVNRGVVSISDGLGVIASFEPVCPLVSEGQLVRAGQVIAVQCGEERDSVDPEEKYEHCAVACVHISARINGEYLSPLHLIYGLEASRLWPLSALN